jgi:Na+/H+-translocating membrane pyrophosphatase
MEKLLVIISLTQRIYGKWLFQKLLSGIMVAAGLTIVISIMVSAMLVGGLYTVYFALLYYGIEQLMAMLVIGILAIMITVMLVIVTFSCLHRLRRMPRTLLEQSPFTSRAMDTLDAFTNGLMAE